ncbi:hypothetical protein QNN08_11345 [Escherichia fergusonii]|uniref:hypothetical protein n=1 Tax=Escherichia fergusonii TaxID=564 RepID=UPI0025B6F26B|nr:hypothetical protein [Escherichia fergusonii]MDN4049013.1 hypothetical protein [Escherichia fergusonii]
MMSLWDALRMNMMISYQELVRTFPKKDTKTKTKRVIGVRETKKRKLIYDFYEEAEKGVTTIVSGMKGHFKLKKG